MILAGENGSNQRETRPDATLSTTNSTSNGLILKMGLRNIRQVPDRQNLVQPSQCSVMRANVTVK